MQYTNVMTLDYFNDFYYLEALKTDIRQRISASKELEFRHSVVKLLEDVEWTFEETAKNLAYRTYVYIWAACLGEARHASDTMTENRFISQIKHEKRGDVFSVMQKFPPTPHNIQTVINLFSDKWRGSFGGKAWKHIAESLQFYAKDPATFIDHVIDLEHNTGTVFNKTESRDYLAFSCSYHGDLKDFLDYKFRKNILEQTHYQTIYLSREVYMLVKRHNVIFGTKTWWVEPRFRALPDYQVKWGKAELKLENKWGEFVNVRRGNVPTSEHVASLCQNEIRNQLWKSEEELTQICKDIIRKSGIKAKAKTLRKVNVRQFKDVNSQRLSMIPVTYKISYGVVKVLSNYGTYSFMAFDKDIPQINEYQRDGYLCVKKSVLYLVCEEGEFTLRARDLPHFIQNVEA